MDVEGEVDEVGVHDEGKSAFALFEDSVGKHGLVVANGGMISVGEEGLEVSSVAEALHTAGAPTVKMR